MLRTAFFHSARLSPCASAPSALAPLMRAGLAQRHFSVSSPHSNVLSSPKAHEESFTGTEGHHIKDLPTRSNARDSSSAPETSPPSSPDDVLYRGDWVLFHPVYSPEELKAVEVVHRKATTLADRNAWRFMKLARWGFDLISGYRHKEVPPNANMTLEELRKKGYVMDEHAWLNRILFLESIAGVPGMVAATCRHLKSLRLMRRDSGWIHTLLEEAENERMHLMTFMTLRNPGWFFRMLILGAQGVFYNIFFFSYLVSPRVCHRFVGYLEEEAVITYSRCIKEMEAGRLPEWTKMDAPEIAKDYWRLPKDAKMLEVIYAVRSDESTHRFVNHSLANLDHNDVNPFALREPDMHVKGKIVEFAREDSAKYVQESHDMLGKKAAEKCVLRVLTV